MPINIINYTVFNSSDNPAIQLIAALGFKLKAVTPVNGTPNRVYTFTKSIQHGELIDEGRVVALGQWLNSNGFVLTAYGYGFSFYGHAVTVKHRDGTGPTDQEYKDFYEKFSAIPYVKPAPGSLPDGE